MCVKKRTSVTLSFRVFGYQEPEATFACKVVKTWKKKRITQVIYGTVAFCEGTVGFFRFTLPVRLSRMDEWCQGRGWVYSLRKGCRAVGKGHFVKGLFEVLGFLG